MQDLVLLTLYQLQPMTPPFSPASIMYVVHSHAISVEDPTNTGGTCLPTCDKSVVKVRYISASTATAAFGRVVTSLDI